jgi:hypothetical protein
MEWISVKDRKPKLGIQNRYLFVNGKGEVTFGYAYSDEDAGTGKWLTDNENSIWINDMDRETNETATHWMELPKAPDGMD